MTVKKLGLVRDVFNEARMQKLMGNAGVGHCRYPTVCYECYTDVPLPHLMLSASRLLVAFEHHCHCHCQRHCTPSPHVTHTSTHPGRGHTHTHTLVGATHTHTHSHTQTYTHTHKHTDTLTYTQAGANVQSSAEAQPMYKNYPCGQPTYSTNPTNPTYYWSRTNPTDTNILLILLTYSVRFGLGAQW
jgi:hypothetical protein